jgi:LPXTG-site transpeptidase (sortase) family protein
MKNILLLFIFSFAFAIVLMLSVGGNHASSYMLGVTNTPSASSPTPLPTEILTDEPPLLPTNTISPPPTTTPHITATLAPTTKDPKGPEPKQNTPVLPALGKGEAARMDLAKTSPIARIVIPSLKLDTAIRRVPFQDNTWDISNLGFGVGWLANSSWPSLGGNTVMVGHLNMRGDTGPFEKLGKLKPGSRIIIYTKNTVFYYSVREFIKVASDDLSVLDESIQPQLTLITCYPPSWDSGNQTYRERQAVVADLYDLTQVADLGYSLPDLMYHSLWFKGFVAKESNKWK